MGWVSELFRVFLVLFLTALLVAFLWQVPGFLALLLLVPLALSWWFWPEASTALAYFVGAVVGTLFTYWSLLGSVSQPADFSLWWLWTPLVWGPAGVVVKRFEVLLTSFWRGDDSELPEFD